MFLLAISASQYNDRLPMSLFGRFERVETPCHRRQDKCHRTWWPCITRTLTVADDVKRSQELYLHCNNPCPRHRRHIHIYTVHIT